MSEENQIRIEDNVLLSPNGDNYNHIKSVEVFQKGDGEDEPQRTMRFTIEDSKMVIKEVDTRVWGRLRNEPGVRINLTEEGASEKSEQRDWYIVINHHKGNVYINSGFEESKTKGLVW